MPKKTAELTDIEVRRITKRGLHAVGSVAGLFLQVARGGSRSWILRAMVGSRRRDIGLGAFPDVKLAEARQAARAARAQIRAGLDPVAERAAARQSLIAAQHKRLTFAEAARRKHAAIASGFRNPKHARQWLSSLEQHAFPAIGAMEVDAIQLPDVLKVLEPIWMIRTETASRVRQRMEAVFTWALVSGYREGTNPAIWKANLAEVLPAPRKVATRRHQRALPWRDVPAFMDRLRERDGMAPRALAFAILTAARSGEVRSATWDETDLETGTWTIPGTRTKSGKTHTVPLSEPARAILETVPRLAESPFVFPASRGGALSDMSLSALTRRMGVDATPHGFRSSFKDWARNETTFADEVSELALAHVNSDATRAAYARDELLAPRARLMAQWASFLTVGATADRADHTVSDRAPIT